MAPQKPIQPITDIQPPALPAQAVPTKPIPAPTEENDGTPIPALVAPVEQHAKPPKKPKVPRKPGTVPVAIIVCTVLVTLALAAVAVDIYYQQNHKLNSTTSSNSY